MSQVSAQGPAPVPAETLVVVPCAGNKKEKETEVCQSQGMPTGGQPAELSGIRGILFLIESFPALGHRSLGPRGFCVHPVSFDDIKYSPPVSDLAFGARFTNLGANFRLRHLTCSTNSPPHVLDVLAGSLRTTRFIGSRSVQLHQHTVASSGFHLPPVCISISPLVRLSDANARSRQRPLDPSAYSDASVSDQVLFTRIGRGARSC